MEEALLFLTPLLESPQIRADFVERIPEVETSTNKGEVLARLQPHHQAAASNLGFAQTYHAEQVHGEGIAHITKDSPLLSLGMDGLMTSEPGILLGIHVADCGAVYILDQRLGALALIHSGKKGTELNITGKMIAAMQQTFGSRPNDLTIVLGPCIRPPHYEINFAAQIREQVLAAGVPESQYFDCALCTASDLTRFYSYRIEMGNTGRHLALLGSLPS